MNRNHGRQRGTRLPFWSSCAPNSGVLLLQNGGAGVPVAEGAGFAFGPDDVDRCGIEGEAGAGLRTEAERERAEDAQRVTVAEAQRVATRDVAPVDDSLDAARHLLQGFAAGDGAPPDRPVGDSGL